MITAEPELLHEVLVLLLALLLVVLMPGELAPLLAVKSTSYTLYGSISIIKIISVTKWTG